MTQNQNRDPLGDLRRQLAELRSALEQNSTFSDENRHLIESARSKVSAIISNCSNPQLTLFELPKLVTSLMSSKMLGALFVGTDGRLLLYNGTAQQMLNIDPQRSFKPSAAFFNSKDRSPLEEEQLPWQRALSGHDSTATQLVVRRPNESAESIIDVSAVALRGPEDEVGGAMCLLVDMTEHINAENHIKTLCSNLEAQLHAIEAAQSELGMLAAKLGQKWSIDADADTANSKKSVEKVSESATSQTLKTVLVVDDIPVNQKLLIMQLSKLGVTIDTANNGLEALNASQKQDYALIFMDLDMPVMNGCEATLAIRKAEATTQKHVPIVAVTSFDRGSDRERCLNSGMDEFLHKGATKAQIKSMLDRFVFGTASEPIAESTPPPQSESSASTPEISAETKVDVAALERAYGIEEARRILAMFLGSASTMVNCIELAIDDCDSNSVKHFAYSLKGPCSSLGLHSMAQLCARITADAESGNWNGAKSLYQVLRDEFSIVKEQIGCNVYDSMSSDERQPAAARI